MNTTLDAKTETSGLSECFLSFKKPTLDDTSAKTSVVSPGNTKYKGVVMQHNGHWGAQLYTNHRRIWLGTFKSATEAAKNYDSASMKLRGSGPNSHRNFPWDEFTDHEQKFQERYTTEVVLNMIKDGSYQDKFRDFVLGSKQSREDEVSNKFFSWRRLFQKELTLSDVGKLNRLVIPKKYALEYLPVISDDRSEREEGEIREDAEEVEVVFYDGEMREWKFRYCYWSSSQSYVFTRGWIAFVKDKQLKEKDIVVFYTCDVKTLEGQSKNILIIDVHHFSEKDFVVPDEVNKTVHHASSDPIEKETGNIASSKVEEETKSEEKKGGFMLFGVRIQ